MIKQHIGEKTMIDYRVVRTKRKLSEINKIWDKADIPRDEKIKLEMNLVYLCEWADQMGEYINEEVYKINRLDDGENASD